MTANETPASIGVHHDASSPTQSQLNGANAVKPLSFYQPNDGTRIAGTELGSNTAIEYRYLTFETDVPTPPTAVGQELPPCPDLKPYTSPLKWSVGRKSGILVLSCIATFLTAYTAGAYSPPANVMAHDFHTSRTVVLLGITTFCMGFAFAPMALAPISEVWGRFPVFAVAGVVFVIFQAACSVMPNIEGMLVARLFVGIGASVFSTIIGGVIADLWDKKDRNTPMALFSGSVLAGTGAGPLVSTGLIATLNGGTISWKWSFWHQTIMDAVLMIAILLFFKESRASVLLTRKAKKLNEWYEKLEKAGVYGMWVHDSDPAIVQSARTSTSGSALSPDSHPNEIGMRNLSNSDMKLRRIRWLVKADEDRQSVGTIIATSIKRPFFLLFTEPVVFCFSLWAAFSWGVLYLSFSVVPILYGTNLELSSRVYVAIMAASAVATITGIWQERILKHPQWKAQHDGFQYSDSKFWAIMRKNFPAEAPESRLYFACITTLLLPAGLWGAFLGPNKNNGYAEAVGLGFAIWGIYSVYLATFNYLADTYHIYASSALAAQNFCRNVLGGIFPLVTAPLFKNLGLKGAGGLLGGIAAALTIIPWILVFFGERIRARSKFAISLEK